MTVVNLKILYPAAPIGVRLKWAKRDGIINVGHPTRLKNRFKEGRDGTREQVVALYRDWLWGRVREGDAKILAALWALPPDAKLGCWCKPMACHGDVIVEVATWLREQPSGAAGYRPRAYCTSGGSPAARRSSARRRIITPPGFSTGWVL
jgi:hypothetical protein